MKLELKHLAPYLPYGLKIMVDRDKANISYMSSKRIAFCYTKGYGEVEKIQWKYAHKSVRPILRAKKSLTKNELLVIYQKTGVSIDYEEKEDDIEINANHHYLSYKEINKVFEILYSLHIDVNDLIKKGLAIDINTLKST